MTEATWVLASERPGIDGAYWINQWTRDVRGVKIGYWLTDCHGDSDWCGANGERIYGVTHWAHIEYPSTPVSPDRITGWTLVV
jgi:hypothetical protein